MEPVHDRVVLRRYLDPVDLAWLATARRLGITVRRDPSIFSATDGSGRLVLGPRSTLDPDDCVAQMIFHEICHWIVNGEGTLHQRDWGFALDAELDWREHSALRLQAAWAGEHGLREVLAPTSQFRAYYDAIPADAFQPLDEGERESKVVARAREAWAAAHGRPWGGPVGAALAATAAMKDLLAPFMDSYASDVDDDDLPSLWACPSSG